MSLSSCLTPERKPSPMVGKVASLLDGLSDVPRVRMHDWQTELMHPLVAEGIVTLQEKSTCANLIGQWSVKTL